MSDKRVQFLEVVDEETRELYERIHRRYLRMLDRTPSREEIRKEQAFYCKHGLHGYEWFFCPETWFYDTVLGLLEPDDIVFDVGAGDLRFAVLAAWKCRKVYAVELNPTIVGYALSTIGYDMPPNLVAICGDAWKIDVPDDVTTITCLMIHRTREFPEKWFEKRIIYTTRSSVRVYDPETKFEEIIFVGGEGRNDVENVRGSLQRRGVQR